MPASATRRRSRFAFLRFSAVKVARNASKDSIAAIEPMELAVAPQDQTALCQRRELCVRGEEHVPGGEPLDRAHARAPRGSTAARIASALRRRVHQQARPAHRRERHGGKQLRVVLQAVLRIGICPGEIEYELAARVAFAIQRHCAHQPPRGVLRNQVLRRPAGLRRGAAGLLERRAEIRVAGRAAPSCRRARSIRLPRPRRCCGGTGLARRITRARRAASGATRRRDAPGTCRRRERPCSRCPRR